MGHVYLVQNNNHIKIGFSNDVYSRLKQLTKTPYENKLIAYKDGVGYEFESQLHEMYSEFRGNGEWFLLTKENIEYIINTNSFKKINDVDVNNSDVLEMRLQLNKVIDNSIYINIKEAMVLFSKSRSTIKRMVYKIRTTPTDKFDGNEVLTLERLPNGKDKVFILKSYLESKYNNNNIRSNHVINYDNSKQELENIIDLLKRELNEKNTQISSLLTKIR